MKTILPIFLCLILFKLSFSQERFNVILEDTLNAHISNTVVESNGNYYILSGTGNELDIRSFCISEVNEQGYIQWQEVFGSDSLETWEGWEHSLKKSGTNFFLASTIKNINTYDNGFRFYKFNQDFSLIESPIVKYDTNWSQCYNSILDNNKNAFLTGNYYDTIANNYCFYLSKYDSAENLLWRKTITDSYSYGAQLLECRNGSIICGGGQSNSGNTRCLLASYKPNGENNWHGLYGDGSVKALLETPDSCILACGSYPGIKVFVYTYYDGCIRKIDQEGELLWEQFYRTYTIYTNSGKIMSGLNFNHILSDQLGNYYAIGSTYAKNPLWRGFLMKLNENGKILFRRLYYSINEESNAIYLNSGSFTTDNGFILLGYGNAYDWFDIYPPQQRWLIKTDSMGMDGLCNTEPDALEVDIDFPEYLCANDTAEVYVYIAGPTAPYKLNISNGQTFDSIYYPPVFVPNEIGPGTIYVPYNLTENIELYEPNVTIANHEWGECIAIPIEYVVGNQLGYETLDITVTDGWGNSKTISKNIFVKTCPNGISSAELENSLQIYPNPASDFLTVELDGNMQDFPISIVDMSGKVVLQTLLMDESTSIDIRTLPAGNYQLMIEGVSKSFSVVR